MAWSAQMYPACLSGQASGPNGVRESLVYKVGLTLNGPHSDADFSVADCDRSPTHLLVSRTKKMTMIVMVARQKQWKSLCVGSQLQILTELRHESPSPTIDKEGHRSHYLFSFSLSTEYQAMGYKIPAIQGLARP